VVRLTPRGRREWHRLDRRSEALARRLVDPLSDRQRSELASALATAERLLRAATVDVETVEPRSAAAQAALVAYFGELDDRFPTGFDASPVAEGDAAALRPPHGAFLVVRSDQVPIGCGGVQRIDESTAEIKRMWIHHDWRGLGLGRRLLARLEDVAGGLGYTRVVLDTNATLIEAIAMYERSGYHSIERYNDNPYAQRWFAKDL
jgi:GNAT superfamily N-acetyltransferase